MIQLKLEEYDHMKIFFHCWIDIKVQIFGKAHANMWHHTNYVLAKSNGKETIEHCFATTSIKLYVLLYGYHLIVVMSFICIAIYMLIECRIDDIRWICTPLLMKRAPSCNILHMAQPTEWIVFSEHRVFKWYYTAARSFYVLKMFSMETALISSFSKPRDR